MASITYTNKDKNGADPVNKWRDVDANEVKTVVNSKQDQLAYTPENVASKDVSGGYVGLTLMKINFWNALATFKSLFVNSNTAARTYTFQDRDGTIADNTDLAAKLNTSSYLRTLVTACSDEVTSLVAGTSKVTFRMPYSMTLTTVRASLATAQTSGAIFTVDIKKNGASILSTKITIDNTEKTSVTAVTPPVLSSSVLADDDEITVDISQVGDGTAKGLKIALIGTL